MKHRTTTTVTTTTTTLSILSSPIGVQRTIDIVEQQAKEIDEKIPAVQEADPDAVGDMESLRDQIRALQEQLEDYKITLEEPSTGRRRKREIGCESLRKQLECLKILADLTDKIFPICSSILVKPRVPESVKELIEKLQEFHKANQEDIIAEESAKDLAFKANGCEDIVSLASDASQDLTEDLIDQLNNSDPGTASQLQEIKDALEGSGPSEGGLPDATKPPEPTATNGDSLGTFGDPPADTAETLDSPSINPSTNKEKSETMFGSSVSASASASVGVDRAGGVASASAESKTNAETTGGDVSASSESKTSVETTGGDVSASSESKTSVETNGGDVSASAKSKASAETTGGAASASADSEAKANANTGATTTTTTSAASTTTSTTSNQQSDANGITGEQITTLTEKVGEVAEKMEKLQEEMRLQMEEQASKKTYSRRKRQTVSCSLLINLMQKLAALRIETEELVASQNFEESTLPDDVRAQLEEFKKYHQLILQGIYTEEASMRARYSANCGAGTGIGARMFTADHTDRTDQTTSTEGRVEANDEASVKANVGASVETNAKANAKANVKANAEANVEAVVEPSAEANAKTTTGEANDPSAKTELEISGTGNKTKTARRVTKDRVVDQTVSIKTSGENGTTASATAFVKDNQRPNKQ